MVKVNEQDRQWEGMMGWGRGAAPAGWLRGVVGAERKPAQLPAIPLTARIIGADGSGLRFGLHCPRTPPSRRRAPTPPSSFDHFNGSNSGGNG